MHRLLPTAKIPALSLLLMLLPAVASGEPTGNAVTEVFKDADGLKLLHHGKPLWIQGAVAPDRFDVLRACGANAVRTVADKVHLDAAQAAGLLVMADIDLPGERDGMDWNDDNLVSALRDRVLAKVREFQNHPAVLMWVLGNELDYIPPDEPYQPKIWKCLNQIAEALKALDPNHPVLTVIGTSRLEGKVKELARDGTAFDLLGLNAYGDLGNATAVLKAYWPKPYVVSEWGPTGHWEVPKTTWKAAIEQTSSEKAAVIAARYRDVILANRPQCLGSFVFYWSEKQETTHTWYGLFCDGLRTESIDVMEQNWTSHTPANQAPHLRGVTLDGVADKTGLVLQPHTRHRAEITATDPDGDALRYQWDIRPEVLIPRNSYAGGLEKSTRPLDGVFENNSASSAAFVAPEKEGAYRVFVTVKDGKGAIAYANFPFFVSKTGAVFEQQVEEKAWQQPNDLGNPVDLGKGIQRTMTLLATSTPERRNTVKILFYGQSITEQDWTRQVEADLRKRFPAANLIVENRALGGYSSQRLVHTVETDVLPFQPDLMIFHVFGADKDYENLIRRIRERTTAEVLILTDHVAAKEAWKTEPTAPPIPSTTEFWPAYMNYEFLPHVIKTYDCGWVDQRRLWKEYLVQTGLEPQGLLVDTVHLNPEGCRLMATFVEAALVVRPSETKRDPMNDGSVRTFRAGPDVAWEGNTLTLTFEGTRCDLVAPSSPKGSVNILVDGKKPSEHPEILHPTRALAKPGGKWPVLYPIEAEAPLKQEDWHLDVTRLDDEGTAFSFKLKGTVTGEDGEGRSDQLFKSKSGRVVLKPASWDVLYALNLPRVPIPPTFSIDWQVSGEFVDSWKPGTVQSGIENVTTVIQGLADGPHTLTLSGDSAAVERIRIYSPKKRKEERDRSILRQAQNALATALVSLGELVRTATFRTYREHTQLRIFETWPYFEQFRTIRFVQGIAPP